jgi:hypothetical protein
MLMFSLVFHRIPDKLIWAQIMGKSLIQQMTEIGIFSKLSKELKHMAMKVLKIN